MPKWKIAIKKGRDYVWQNSARYSNWNDVLRAYGKCKSKNKKIIRVES